MRIFNVHIVVALFISVILGGMIYSEYIIKKGMYFNEKVSDLKLQYNDKIVANKKISEALFDDVLENKIALKLIDEANKEINKDSNREKLFKLFEKKYQRMNKKGILQFHFHLADGTSFLRFHKPSKFGDSILFRKSIKKVIKTKKPVYGFEVGRYFEKFRYVYPLFLKGKYIGSVESSVKAKEIITQMKESLDAKYSMVLKKDLMDHFVNKEHIKKHYHMFCVNDNYYMANKVHHEKSLAREALKKIKSQIKDKLKKNLAFAKHSTDSKGNVKVFVFVPIKDIEGKNAGYIFSIRDDNIINDIVFMQYLKFAFGIFLIALLTYLYGTSKQKTNTIQTASKCNRSNNIGFKNRSKG